MAALLRQIGGREVDGDPLGGQRDGERAQRAAHPVARLGHRLVGQADDGKARQAGGDGALHLDQPSLDPLEGDGIGA